MDPKIVGNFIIKLRKEHNLTQKELADKIHVTDKAVSKWERGIGLPDISLLQPLSEALGVSILELLNGKYINKDETTDKNDIELLLNTLARINKEYKIDRLIGFTLIFLVILASITLTYLKLFYHTFDNSYIFQLSNNLSLIPFSNLYIGIIHNNLSNFFKNLIINSCLSLIISSYLIIFIKNKKVYSKIMFVINLLLELIKWVLLIGLFDINDLLIRLTISIIFFNIYTLLKCKIKQK